MAQKMRTYPNYHCFTGHCYLVITDNLTLQSIPVLADGFRICWDEEEGNHLLLFPEGMVVLDDIDRRILEYCSGSTTIEEIIKEINTTDPHNASKEQVQSQLEYAINNGWLEFI